MRINYLPKDWQEIELGNREYFEINSPKSEISELPENTTITFLGMENIGENGEIFNKPIKRLKEVIKGYTYFRKRDILFAKITPCMENGKGAIAKIDTEIGFGSTEFHVIRVKKKVLPQWVYLFLSLKTVRKSAEMNMTGSAGQKRVPVFFLKKLKIPLPPLNTQKKIVSILEQAESLKQKREQADKLTEEYLKSVFYEMFLNKNFNKIEIEKVAKIISGSTPSTHVDKYWNGNIDWITPAELIDGPNYYYYKTERKITEAGLKSCSSELFPKDTVMLTTRAPIGKVAIAGSEMCSNQGFKNFICDKKRLNYVYLYYWFLLNKNYLQSLGRGATFGEVSKSNVAKLKIPLPPLDLQKKFSSVVEHVERLKEKQNKGKERIDEMFNSLMQKAFGGELIM